MENATGRERFLQNNSKRSLLAERATIIGGTFYGFVISEKRPSDFEKRVASAVDGLAHLRIDVNGFRARAKRSSFSDAPTETAHRLLSPAGSWDGGGARRICTSYQCPVLGIEAHGSAGGFASPFCKSSIECRSGERTNAIWPSRGGRLMVMPIFISRSQVA
jgi:hypothetical protein